MLLLRTGRPEARKGDIELNLIAILAVNEQLDYLLAEAAQRRALQSDKPSLRARLAATISSARSAIQAPVESNSSILPTLDDYPYRS